MTRNRVAVIAMLAAGLGLWVSLPYGLAGQHVRTVWWRWLAAGLAAATCLIPRFAQWFDERLNSLRAMPPRSRTIAAIAISCVAALYFLLTAINQQRDFFPKTHDECSYEIQVRQLAIGRLWMPQHPLADFFDSFYLITRPVYASIYFPGAAMLNVPATWLHAPTWLIPLIIAAAIVGLSFIIISELTDPAFGLLAALWIISLSWFRMHSIMLMSQLPLLLLGLIAIWSWLRWRRSGCWPWLLLVGVASGWAAITRPLDAIAYAAPIGIAVLIELRAKPKQLSFAALLVVIGALPFLVIQAISNKGITGHWLQTPFDLYASKDLPGTSYGFHPLDPNAKVQSAVIQRQIAYDTWAKPYIERHQPSRIVSDWWNQRFAFLAEVAMPARAMLIFLPLGLLGLTDRKRWLLFATLPLFLLLYVGYTFFLEHYILVVVPAIALLAALSVDRLAAAWPGQGPRLLTAGFMATIAFCLTGTYELNHQVSDEPFHSTLLRGLHELAEPNSIILFTYNPTQMPPASITQEPVYNTDVPWPDDAPMIRAHDLGPRNVELFRYYAQRQPTRVVHVFDLATGNVQDLGSVKNLVPR